VTPSVTPTGKTCTATYRVVQTWPGGFQGEVNLKAGSTAITGWKVSWPVGSGQTITQVWNGQVVSGAAGAETVTNYPWNGSLAAVSSVTVGLLGSGQAPNPVPAVTCTAT